jgi:hypothetical protein
MLSELHPAEVKKSANALITPRSDGLSREATCRMHPSWTALLDRRAKKSFADRGLFFTTDRTAPQSRRSYGQDWLWHHG